MPLVGFDILERWLLVPRRFRCMCLVLGMSGSWDERESLAQVGPTLPACGNVLVPPQVWSHSDSFPLIPWLPRVEGRGRLGLAPVRVWADHPVPPTGSRGATRKYKIWMRHRYQSCCNRLGELLAHPSFQVKVSWGDWLCLLPARPLPHLLCTAGVWGCDCRPLAR